MESINADSPAVGSLVMSDACLHPATVVRNVVERFFESAQLDALAVVEGREAVGLVTRTKLLFSVFKRYGFELYGKKPVFVIADLNPLYIHERERLDVAIDMALARKSQDIYDEIIITDEDGHYKGLLPVRQMIIQQSNLLANSIVQREVAHERARGFEKINSIKSQFIANVTHELRSPVNAIIGLAELMKMSCDKGYMDQLRDRLSLLMSNAANLRAVITNILDLSKLEAGKLEITPEEFDLKELLQETAETTRVLLGAKPVNVDISVDDSIYSMLSDRVKVRQIVMNLMSNAAKFTDRGQIILSAERKGEDVVISISDTGIGTREKDLQRLFEAFSQLEDAKTKRHEGTGLGLTITKNLVNLLAGCISIRSEFGKGSTFNVELPLQFKIIQQRNNS
jgi:signal transduction histidine kinase